MTTRILTAAILAAAIGHLAIAETLELQSNPVPQGTIKVAEADADRSDWADIPWYEWDEDFTEFYPVDIDRIQIAHDDTHVYFHIEALEWDTEETWRIGTYIDSDVDALTGYTGDFLPLGADYLLEGAAAYQFTAATQVEWGWAEVATGVRDQSTALDVELALPRTAIGNPTEFDFILYANNMCCDFQMPDDIYPNDTGFVFTYELGESNVVPGDFDGNGSLDALDIDALSEDVAQMSNTLAYDLTGDGMTTSLDVDAWLTIKGTINGDADLSGDVAFGDFLTLSAAFGQAGAWSSGDFDSSGSVQFADFLILSTNFGKGGAAAATVPEGNSVLPMLIGLLFVSYQRRRRTNR